MNLDDLDDEAPIRQSEEALRQRELTVRQVRVLAVKHAAPDKSNLTIARLAGVPYTSFQYWLAQPYFAQLWNDRSQRHQAIVNQLRAEGEIQSLQTLISVQKDSDTVASTRVDAAARLLTAVQRAREHETVSAGQWLAQGKWAEMFEESKEMLKEAVEGEVIDGSEVAQDAGRVDMLGADREGANGVDDRMGEAW